MLPSETLTFGVLSDGSEYGSESSVASYSKQFPVQFTTASGSFVHDSSGRKYLDFLCGQGAIERGI